jgi:pimeloyl-ACP methyl ester carboxylesterase
MRRDFPIQHVTLHGSTVGYRMAGDGPAIVLLHGITSTSDVWVDAMARLSDRFTVVAPDLLGHGRSAPPRGD